jgi:hypothetical protein
VNIIDIGYSALLGRKFAPTSLDDMATAIPIEFSYRASKEKSPQFYAEIDMISSTEFYDQVQTIQASADSDLYGMEAVRYLELRQRARLIFPFIQWHNVHIYDMRAVFNHDSVKEELGQTIYIKEEDHQTFIRKLEDIGMAPIKFDVSGPWLLVARARVYLDSDILGGGITLVDLPGRPGATYYKPVEDTLNSLNAICVCVDSSNRAGEPSVVS